MSLTQDHLKRMPASCENPLQFEQEEIYSFVVVVAGEATLQCVFCRRKSVSMQALPHDTEV